MKDEDYDIDGTSEDISSNSKMSCDSKEKKQEATPDPLDESHSSSESDFH